MKTSGIIYYHDWDYRPPSTGAVHVKIASKQRQAGAKTVANKHASTSWSMTLGIGILSLALGGVMGPLTPRLRLEAKYATIQVQRSLPVYTSVIQSAFAETITSLASFARFSSSGKRVASAPRTQIVPAAFDPLKTPDGASINPVNKEFSLIVPKIGINAAIIPAVNPTKPGEYMSALQKGIAHSSLSYFPDEDGTVYLFSHSTNYDWFVGDLNAVFYLLKNLEEKDTIIIFYKGSSYRYEMTGKQIVNPTEISYLAPQAGARRLILQTCWPPGSVAKRLLIFADLVEVSNEAI